MIQPKGADRKQKTDREKMEKRAPQEKEKYQPSYETTILTEVSSSPVKRSELGSRRRRLATNNNRNLCLTAVRKKSHVQNGYLNLL